MIMSYPTDYRVRTVEEKENRRVSRKSQTDGSLYKGYRLRNHGYYPPGRCIWWEAINTETDEADFHAHTKRELKHRIDEANKGI